MKSGLFEQLIKDLLILLSQCPNFNPQILRFFPIPFLASEGSLSEKNLHHHKESFVDFSHQFEYTPLKKGTSDQPTVEEPDNILFLNGSDFGS